MAWGQQDDHPSEIVSGAIQDLDRGVIIGSPTFGKGLVQTVIPLTRDGNSLKITSAKYYIPSGRLIQKPNFIRKKDIIWDYESKEDTTKKEEKTYFTAAKREVKGSGGITPDIKVELPEVSSLVINLIMKSMFFNFALEYASDNGNLEKDFVVDEKLITEFKDFLKEKNFTYKTEAENHVAALEKIIQKEKYSGDVLTSFNNFKKDIESVKKNNFKRDLKLIKRRLGAEIAAKLWGTKGKYENEFKWMPEIKKAVEVLTNQDEYLSLLNSADGK